MRPRRRKRRWAAIPVVLVSALLFGLFAELDLDSFRGRVVDSVSAWLDRPVTLGGRLGIRLAANPVLVLPELEVGDRLLTAREARITVAFWPLLVGRIEPKSIALVGPSIRLAAFAAWRTSSGAWPTLPIERLEITDAVVEGPEGRLLEQLALTIAPASPVGPFDVRGTGRSGGEPVRFEMTLGRLDSGRPVGFAAKVQGGGMEAALTGAANRGGAGLELGGPLKLTAADASKSLARIGIVSAPFAGPGTVEAKLAWAEGRVTFSDFAFESDGTRVTGRIDLAESLRAGEVQLAFGRLEAERWRDTVLELRSGADGRDLSVLLSAEAISLRGALVRQARAELRLLDRQMALRQLQALAPGGTEITAFGRISSTGTKPVYEGEIDLLSDNLRVALAWLGLEPSGVAPDRLRRVQVSLRASFDGERVTVPSFDLKLDTSRMLGSGSLVPAATPRVDLRVAIDRITLDPYLPLFALAFDAGVLGNLTASADLATWQGIGLRDLDIDAVILPGGLDLRKFRVGEVAAARFTAAGRVSLADANSDLSFDLTTRRPSELFRLFANGDAAVLATDGAISAAGKLQGALFDLKLSGAVVSPEGTSNLDGRVDLTGPGAPTLHPGPGLRRMIDRLAGRGGR
ncbi:MAG: hypothetical protein FJX54_24575 [Alphaproteobacteria bacterium]|nr:hypothetical protein [Alphaproteobacteria bacterium]